MTPKHVYHLAVDAADLGRYVFLVGDPGRVPKLADFFDQPRELATARGLVVHGGLLEGERVAAVCTGMGNPSTAIVVEELIALGATTLLRVGTCGSLQDDVLPGHLVTGTAAIRDEGTTRQYVPVEYPAVADPDVLLALRRACADAKAPFHCGVVHSKDAFYSELPEYTADPEATARRWKAWSRAGALATDMEAAALFILAGMRRCRAGVLLAVVGSTTHGTPISDKAASDVSLPVAIEAMRRIIRQDREGRT